MRRGVDLANQKKVEFCVEIGCDFKNDRHAATAQGQNERVHGPLKRSSAWASRRHRSCP